MPEIHVTDEKGIEHVFPDGSTPEMITKALGVGAPKDDMGGFAPGAMEPRRRLSAGPDLSGAIAGKYGHSFGRGLRETITSAPNVITQLPGKMHELVQGVKAGAPPKQGPVRSIAEGYKNLNPISVAPQRLGENLGQRVMESAGLSAPQIMMMLEGAGEERGQPKSKGIPQPPRKQVARLTSAIQGKGEIAANIEQALPDINAEVAKQGGIKGATPKETLKSFYDAVHAAERGTNNQYALAIQKVAGEQIVPESIANDLKARANNLSTTAEGQAEAKYLRKIAAREYSRPRSIRDLEAERIERAGRAESYYNKALRGQISSQQAGRAAELDATIAASLRDVLYDEVLQKRFPETNWRELKRRQGALIKVKQHLQETMPELHTKQLADEGRLMRESISATTSVHPTGATSRLHGLTKAIPTEIMKSGAEDVAAVKIRKAYKQKPARRMRGGVPPPPIRRHDDDSDEE
jgi:hypothetical protein